MPRIQEVATGRPHLNARAFETLYVGQESRFVRLIKLEHRKGCEKVKPSKLKGGDDGRRMRKIQVQLAMKMEMEMEMEI